MTDELIRFCRDCEYCENGNASWEGKYWECYAPKAKRYRNKVTGEWPKCREMRKDRDGDLADQQPLCSSWGNWFKPKSE